MDFPFSIKKKFSSRFFRPPLCSKQTFSFEKILKPEVDVEHFLN